jgi:DNA-binding response OmpR family regulator
MARILLLDDDPTIRSTAGFVLRHDGGHKVIAVGKISHAIDELSAETFDLAIIDGTIEKSLDGFRFAKELKTWNLKVKILIVSAELEDADRSFHRLTKPISDQELLAKVTQMLET